MRHIRSSLLLVAVALLAALGVWGALSLFEHFALAPAAGLGQHVGQDTGRSELAASPEMEEDTEDSTEEDSNAAEMILHSQLAAFGQDQPQRKNSGSSVTAGSLLRVDHSAASTANSQAEIVGEAAGMQRISEYRGVMWSAPTQKWKAQYTVQSTNDGATATRWLDLGYFDSEVQAAYAYDEAMRRRGNGHAPNYELNFPTTKTGFVADESLLMPRQSCGRVPLEQPLRRPGIGQQLSAADCAFMPLTRPEPYLSHQLALLTDVVVVLNSTLASTARMPVMLWAVRDAIARQLVFSFLSSLVPGT